MARIAFGGAPIAVTVLAAGTGAVAGGIVGGVIGIFIQVINGLIRVVKGDNFCNIGSSVFDTLMGRDVHNGRAMTFAMCGAIAGAVIAGIGPGIAAIAGCAIGELIYTLFDVPASQVSKCLSFRKVTVSSDL